MKHLRAFEIGGVSLCDDIAPLWCRALWFLRTNKALKSLVVDVRQGYTESCLSAYLPNIDLGIRPGDVGAILRLNEAGRWYLIEDGSSVSMGRRSVERNA
jgi:hypothetical protein